MWMCYYWLLSFCISYFSFYFSMRSEFRIFIPFRSTAPGFCTEKSHQPMYRQNFDFEENFMPKIVIRLLLILSFPWQWNYRPFASIFSLSPFRILPAIIDNNKPIEKPMNWNEIDILIFDHIISFIRFHLVSFNEWFISNFQEVRGLFQFRCKLQ